MAGSASSRDDAVVFIREKGALWEELKLLGDVKLEDSSMQIISASM